MHPESSKMAEAEAEPRAPFYRRWVGRIGLQGKLVLSIAYVLLIALGSACWLFAAQSRERVADTMGEQARQLSNGLSMASKSAMEERNQKELKRIGVDLLKSRNVVIVAFLDPGGKSLALASRDPLFEWDSLAALRHNTQALTQVQLQHSRVLGEYLVVMSPVVHAPLPGESLRDEASGRVMGYVVVGLSQAHEQAMMQGTFLLIVGIGVVMMLFSLPLSAGMVHRIFLPIRQLVDATRRIAAGDMSTRVAIDRPDVIGTLARSFNEMVIRVRAQQLELEDANARLAQANVKLNDVNGQLELKVHERTAQLETANRRLSSEIAEKEDFLRAVSHDLNAPLRNISGMTTMLLMKHRDKFDADVVHRLERIQKNVEVETDLISELLELSRIKTRRQRLEVVDVDRIVRDLEGIFEDDLNSRGIDLVLDTPLPALICEKARLRQVFQNLIDNAIKYMGSGNGSARAIHVGCELRESEAEFYVQDSGIGIEPEDLDKVFFVFRRGKSPAVQGVAGKGVGLASVKSIVETYSGTIWVESEVGKGSTFRFTINGQHLAQLAPVAA